MVVLASQQPDNLANVAAVSAEDNITVNPESSTATGKSRNGKVGGAGISKQMTVPVLNLAGLMPTGGGCPAEFMENGGTTVAAG